MTVRNMYCILTEIIYINITKPHAYRHMGPMAATMQWSMSN